MKWMNLTDVCYINDKSVQEFEGLKKYVATGGIDFNNIVASETVTYNNKPSRANREVISGDVIFAKMKGTIKVFKITEEVSDKYIFSTGFTTLNAKLNKLTPDYLYYILISDIFQNQKDKYSSGATQKAINNTNLKKIKIPVPSLAIQEQIVEVLDRAQELIDKRSAQLEALDSLIESIFYSMFGDPVRNEKGWEVKKLGELSSLITKGSSPNWQGIEYVNDPTQTLFVTSENVREGYLDLSKRKYLQDEFNSKQKRSILKKGDFLINIVGASIGRAAQFVLGIKANINQAVSLVRLGSNEINDRYLLIFLNSEGALLQYEKMKVSVARANLSLQNIKDLSIPVPPLDLQNEFAQKVRLIERDKERLEESLELMEENYRSIMDKAFKGELFN